MRRVWIVLAIVSGCGPRIVVDENGGTSDSSSSETSSTSDASTSDSGESQDTSGGGDITGVPPDPATSLETTSTGDSTGAEPDLPCPQLAEESAQCLFLVDNSVYLVGMDSGQWCPVVDASDPIRAFSIVWDFESMYLCNAEDDNTLASVDLLTGLVTRTESQCLTVVSTSGYLLVEPYGPGPWRLYQSFDDVLNQTEHDILDIDPQATRFTASGGVLYGAWHATDSVERWYLEDDSLIDVLALEEFDDWVQGLGVVGTRLFVLAGGGNTILEFADDSGQRIGEFPLEGIPYAQGLACR